MNQLALPFDPPRARTRDPQTSHDAAERAAEFAATHEGIIFGALHDAGMRGATIKEIAAMTRLSDVQVARRLCAMERNKTVRREQIGIREVRGRLFSTPVYTARNGCAVWWVA